MAKGLVLAGKIVGAGLLFVVTMFPLNDIVLLQMIIGEQNMGPEPVSLEFSVSLFALLVVLIWWAFWRWATGRQKSRRWAKEALWVVVPLGLSGVLSVPFWLLFWMFMQFAPY